MINLLPPKEKEELKKEETLKLTLILGIVFLIFLTFLFLMLLSIKIFLNGELEVQKILYREKEEEFNNSQCQVFQGKIEAANEKLLKVDSFYKNQENLSGIMEKISEALPKSAYLTNLSITLPEGKEEKLDGTFSGFALTRETLLEFKQNIEKEFEEINFPASNWVEPENINFSATFKVK